ncbi:CPBP family intramembrane glutamic endopeptidase [Phenylobacterium deserti]|uniref:CPBP family intramembrane metalloprotease n=1 Tax=Phenylobacterium deserti TaxID=1914756 RepID=A0A328ACZ5_9CAUL|nr:CPBP family intramembrane glutamic endopeptidase [Phenylobacterium deserti]RAK52693.1 CPBP family intramembrane metalloprotease [Phenylobacterium deserti]
MWKRASCDHETRRRDFPFYDGEPAALPAIRWLAALLVAAAAFATLIFLDGDWAGVFSQAAPMVLFACLMLTALRVMAGPRWHVLFRRPTGRDIAVGLGGAVLSLSCSGLVGMLLVTRISVAPNPAVADLSDLDAARLVLFVAASAPQILGEELITIIPFLALLTACFAKARCDRSLSVVVAWVGSAVLFALLHLPTYDWHVVQTLAVIGTARLALSVPYLVTKNIWASTFAHVLNDWTLFALAGLLSARL